MTASTTIASLPTPTQADSETLSRAAQSGDSTFKYLYFGLHGRGELTRRILAFAGAKWEELPVDWPSQKESVPFKVLPVVYEVTSDGTVIELAESQAIERYLAQKFNLYGKNVYEHHKVEQYLSSIDGVLIPFGTKVLNSAENRVEEANKIYSNILDKFIAIHEEHLKKNGSNGHYVGNTTTLADLKLALLVDRLFLLKPKGANEVPLSAEKSPNIWKVYETVNSAPHFAAWRNSDKYRELDDGTKKLFKFD
ncbi:hypothetical protein BX616_000403 [Lobosporangium transversale]|uniref:glutathione transferase n=1 Tax=Lobosporangium transversale TaxID=64571 RepID=A0A1Y2GTC7_9FUNG|nr:glutathione S-transferase [Lobosporangium transversale]KAF9917627.1 hypothetical protein BX616_000403 [Lobosporangium transversale]ORZ22777.1 glutathione S-transferase [Lobosporangium transversale]|eukprot:XP_021883331.1 glutathione S-transferase [Lobosporangium transversale]